MIARKLILLILFFFAATVNAQESVTLSVSPTLYDMSAEPGQTWQSTLKIVNVNKFDLTVYIEVVNFIPKGEGGDVRFIPVSSLEARGTTLAEWFSITRDPVTVPREQTLEIPVVVKVPPDAAPGGHYAAILVGTKPLKEDSGSSRLQTAQVVSSLFFSRIAGEIIEAGSIREFTVEDSYLDSPEATFSLRFENKGNVDLQPQGEIRVFNMWGKERGSIPINQYTNFGKVTRDSIRKFIFTWKGEWSVSDIGRYSAVATLGYGISDRKFASAKTYFWVIPYKLLLGIFLGLVVFIILVTWFVKIYIRHMLTMAGINIEDYKSAKKKSVNSVRPVLPKVKLHAPVQAGILDLSKRLKTSISFRERLQTILKFSYQYRLFFIALMIVVAFTSIIVWYISNANTKHRAYEIVYENQGSATSVNSEEIIYAKLKASLPVSDNVVSENNLPEIIIVNRSGTPGTGAKIKIDLESVGYKVGGLSADFSSLQDRTFIVYPANLSQEALKLSTLLNNALVSVSTDVSQEDSISVFLGADVVVE